MSAEYDALLRQIARLPPVQRDVLGSCCIGMDGGHHPATLKALARKGLLEPYDVLEPTELGVFRFTRYNVPIRVHMAWCEWAAAQPDDDPEVENRP